MGNTNSLKQLTLSLVDEMWNDLIKYALVGRTKVELKNILMKTLGGEDNYITPNQKEVIIRTAMYEMVVRLQTSIDKEVENN